MDTEKWIEEIHRNKHNLIPVVKLAIAKPIDALLDSSNHTSDFPLSLLPEIQVREKKAEEIMTYLAAIGNTDSCQEDQVMFLEKQIDHVVNTIIPQIKEFSSFYQQFKDKDFYFTEQRVINLLQKAPSRCEMSCQGLSQLGIANTDAQGELLSIRLIDVIEDVFDELDNITVIYKCANRDLRVRIDVKEFVSAVLLNITENIKRHAFPFEDYKNKLVVDKEVEISITEESDKVLVRVSNNGNPFSGNPDELFNSGYHAGKNGRTGFGLASARKYMIKIGGDIQFAPNDNYSVSFLIIIPN